MAVPFRLSKRKPQFTGPEPFTTEWIESPPESPPPEPPRAGLPSWVPSERALTAVLVLVLVLSTAVIGTRVGDAHIERHATATPPRVAAQADLPTAAASGASTAEAADSTAVATSATAPPGQSPTPLAPIVVNQQPTAAATEAAASPPPAVGSVASVTTDDGPDALLPKYRIISYYGFPGDENMGILGEYDKDTLYSKLQEQADAYQQADPKRPVKLAFEIIASVAQSDPGSDGTYVSHASKSMLDVYADFTAQHDMLLILDVQIGRSTVKDEIEAVRPWLERSNVQLALDPEFAFTGSDKAPGQGVIGGLDASDITDAQQTLAELSQEKGIPPKILIVHQFFESMIRDRDQLSPVPGVQLVIDMDGFGSPDDKTKPYNQFVADSLIQFGGIKLFYKNDDPLMTPEQVLKLAYPPDIVIYQ